MALDPVKLRQPALPLYQVLEEEFTAMGGAFDPAAEVEYLQLKSKANQAREIWRTAAARAGATSSDEDDAACYQHERIFMAAQDECLRVLYAEFHRAGRSALCVSGGGIRSATFSLGVMGKLAELRILPQFDYMSTVSGGGYAGSWLSALIQRVGLERATAAVNPMRDPGEKAVLEPEAQPVRHLRDYSNFLNPDARLTSADTWTLVSTVIRNIILNWLILVPALLAILLAPRVIQLYAQGEPVSDWQAAAMFMAGAISAALNVRYTVLHLPSSRRWVRKTANHGQIRFLKAWLLPLILASLFTSIAWRWLSDPLSLGYWLTQPGSEWAWLAWGVGFQLAGTVAAGYWKLPLYLAAAPTGAVGGLLTFYALRAMSSLDIRLYTVIALPGLLAIFGLLTMLFIGLATRVTTDEDREWWARAGAWSLISASTWTVVTAIALGGPLLLLNVPIWAKSGIAAAGGITGLITIALGRSAKTSTGRGAEAGTEKPSPVYEWALKLAAPMFAVILLAAIALCGHLVLQAIPVGEPTATVLTLLVAGISSVLAGSLINVNKYTLHAMYRDRLIRAYLGASRDEIQRQPDKFTGFDPADNLGMYEVRRQKLVHVVNIALNLVKGARLAWQQRKAESYTVSPWHMGSLRLGYRPVMASTDGSSDDAKREENISLGTAVAISGAAASPNMGYQSSSLVSFLMTMFNARLGWWAGNPGEAGNWSWYKPGPANALKPLFAELFGLTSDSAEYVNLSDGGHFENLALYEMVLRRCRRIVVIDAGCDPAYGFEDLGNAIRKILIDFGIRIEFDGHFDFKPYKDRKNNGSGVRHFALGRICYGDVDEGAPEGELLYIKPVLTGDESRDVLHYATVDDSFPQQPTLTDQNYDESQFESYRRLGYHSVHSFAAGNVSTVDELFAAAARALPQMRAAGAVAGGPGPA